MSTNTEPQWYRNYQTKSVYVSDQQGYTEMPVYTFDGPPENNIVLNAGNEEMLKVTEHGFYVRGVRVEQGPDEARQVYEAFKQWLTWANLTRE